MDELTALRDALEKASLHQLIKNVNELRTTRDGLPVKATVCALRNHTIDNLGWFLEGLGYLDQVGVSYVQGGYDTMMQDVLDASSPVHEAKPDVIVLSLVLDSLVPEYLSKGFSVDELSGRIEEILDALAANSSSLVICNTFLMPAFNSEGFVSHKNRESLENRGYELNARLRTLCQKREGVYLVDWNQIEQRLGIAQSRDYRMWYVARSLLTNRFLKEYALEILKVVRALKGKSKKCVILDCDNTLWGGIIGEDGMDGIKLDAHDYPGSIYYHFQESVLKLTDRGILVALCSKNNEADVWEVLDSHAHCLLKRSHLAAWRVNWTDKASNMRSLAEELNLGLDSFVFVDDSPTECELVRQMLPEVTTLQVPKDLSAYPTLLFEQGLFDALSMSREDKQRAQMYQSEARRKDSLKQFGNIDDFLGSLQLVAEIFLARAEQIPRVAQLTQKTNQFNLTTRRYPESEIKSFVASEDRDVLYLRLKDRFGDYGIVGVCILAYEGDSAVFDTFLMSCRALGRKVEDVFLAYCLNLARSKGKRKAIGRYLPTSKNAQVADFYDRHGFGLVEQDGETKTYALDLASFEYAVPSYFEVIVSEGDDVPKAAEA